MTELTFGSVCSGIEAASVAWHDLGWRAAWLAEIEAFPSAVLAHHYPNVPNLGDMTKIAALVRGGRVAAPDILVGGTPCQAFSVAGLRGGLSDPRGALTLAYVELANEIDAARTVRGDAECVVVWENVPGVLSSKDNAFGCFLGALAGESCELEPEPRPAAGKSSRHWRWDKSTGSHAPSWALAGCVIGPQRSIAWRVLDAQYFGVAQRRRRVFVVASARKGFDPAAILFEFDGLRRDIAPSREAREEAAPDAGSGVAVPGGAGGVDLPAVVGALTSACGPNGHGGSGLATDKGAEAGHIIPVAFGGNRTGGPIDIAPALLAQGGSGYKGDFESETFLVGAGPVGKLQDALSGAGDGTAFCLRQPSNGATWRGDGADNLVAGPLLGGGRERGGYSHDDVTLVPVQCVTGEITHTLKAEGFDASEDGTGRVVPIIPHAAVPPDPIAFDTTQITSATNRCNPQPGDPCHPLSAGAHPPAIAFQSNQSFDSGNNYEISPTLRIGSNGQGQPPAIAFPARMSGTQFASAEDLSPSLGALNPVAVALRGREGGGTAELGDEVQNCLRASSGGGDKPHVLALVAYTTKLHNTSSNQAGKVYEEYSTSLDRSSPPPALLTAMQVRRLTPRECERLQAYLDDYTRIPNWTGWRKMDAGETPEELRAEGLEVRQNKKTLKWSVKDVDGPRYKALGNSMCTYVMAWIGRRIAGALA